MDTSHPASNVSGVIAQLLRASHRYREVTGSNPVEVLTFSGNYLNCVHNCDDHSLLENSNSWTRLMHHLSNLYVRRTDDKEDEENLRTKARHENS